MDYAYNIRGWLTNINNVSTLGNDMFAMELGYTTGTNPQYNGNIASMQWNTSQFGANTYQFDYDGANRLTEAVFTGTGQHNTSYSYDKNGNIETLTRQGRYGGSQFYGSIDTLTYTYQGNQLKSVNDLNDGYGPHQGSGFSDHGSFLTTEYTYDANGNMMADSNKSLGVNQYNQLNLPEQITLNPTTQTQEINYLYDATGNKLRKATRVNYTTENTTDYVGSFIYENGTLQSILTPDGRVVVDGSSYEYQYFLKDHLGNTRVTLNEGGIIQEDSYYPFGMAMAGLSDASGLDLPNKYLYNGKEIQDDFGLEWYDYGARFYDAQLGRWYVVDPAAEIARRWTPYQYTYNNPIRFIDPDGMVVDDYYGRDGKFLGRHGEGTESRYIRESKYNEIVAAGGGEAELNAEGASVPISFQANQDEVIDVMKNKTDAPLAGEHGSLIVFNTTDESDPKVEFSEIVEGGNNGVDHDFNRLAEDFAEMETGTPFADGNYFKVIIGEAHAHHDDAPPGVSIETNSEGGDDLKQASRLNGPVYAVGARGKVIHKVDQNGKITDNIPRNDLDVLRDALKTHGGN